MKIRFLGLFFAFLLALPTAWAEEKSTDKLQFHPPQTEAEKALEKALWIEDIDRTKRFHEVIAWLEGQGDPHSIRYGDYFTRHYLKKWSDTQKDMVPFCKKHADDPNLCKPASLTCNPFSNHESPYEYHTFKSDEKNAVISFDMPDWEGSGGLFHMAKEGSVWKIDGTDCDKNRWHTKK